MDEEQTVKCDNCGWMGSEYLLVEDEEKVEHCPECGEDKQLENL